MLGKLLKYEVKATARLFLPLYLAVLLFAGINKLFNPFKIIQTSKNLNLQSILGTLSIIVYFALIVAIIVMTLLIMIQRFYKNLLGDEGYLMFTLPVKSWEHIVSKLLVSMLWTILSFITVVFSIFILIGIKNVFENLPELFNVVKDYIGNWGIFLTLLYALVAVAGNIITIYCAIALGHLYTKHKILASFGAYIGLYFISQIVLSIFVFSFANTIFYPLSKSIVPTHSQISTLIISFIGVFMVLAAAYFTLTNIILKKRLNLE